MADVFSSVALSVLLSGDDSEVCNEGTLDVELLRFAVVAVAVSVCAGVDEPSPSVNAVVTASAVVRNEREVSADSCVVRVVCVADVRE